MRFPSLNRRWFLGLLAAFAIFAWFSWDLIHSGVFLMHDYTQVGRLAEMQRSLAAGEFPVQWSQNFGFGYGMPLFLFYGPLPFYLGSIFLFAGLSEIVTMKLLFALSGVVGALGIFRWVAPRSRSAAWAAATVFMAMPYRAVDIFVRGALNEVLAMGILPWILVCARLSTKSVRWSVLATSVVTAALLLTHNLTALIGVPVLSGLGMIWIGLYAQRRVKSWLTFISGHILGLGLASFFVWPSLFENKYTQIQQILGGYFDFRLHFLSHHQLLFEHWGFGGSQFGDQDGISFHWGTPAWLAAGILVIILLKLLKDVSQKNRSFSLKKLPARFWWWSSLLTATALCLFLMIGRSQFVWEAVSLLHLIQFPWRFLVVVGVLAPLLVGEVVSKARFSVLRVGLALVFLTLALGQARWHRAEKFLPQPADSYNASGSYIREELSEILPDFLPAGFDRGLPVLEPEQRITVTPGELMFVRNTPQILQADVQATAGAIITWNIADFPGWEYRVNSQAVTPEKLPDGRRQYVSSEPVSHVEARFLPTPIRQAAWTVSLVAGGLWLLLFIPWRAMIQRMKERNVSSK